MVLNSAFDSGRLRAWGWVHRWSSLVCTLFLVLLCLTGLPLVFHDEIAAASGRGGQLAPAPAGAARSIDQLARTALADRPGHRLLFVSFDEDRPVANLTTAPMPGADEAAMTLRAFDRRTGALVAELRDDGVMGFLLQLHTDLFLGLPGMLLLAGIAVLFVVALVSGVVLYAPFMGRLGFAAVRRRRPAQVRWRDWHNLIGIAALAWMAVIGVTGGINALVVPITRAWQADVAAALRAEGTGALPPGRLASLDAAMATALAAVPGSRIQYIALPGTDFTTPRHYAVWLQGRTPLTASLLTPVLVDAHDGTLAGVRPMPLAMQALQLSRPLHFGDYGGLPMKLAWAALTLLTLVVLLSGLWLWARR